MTKLELARPRSAYCAMASQDGDIAIERDLEIVVDVLAERIAGGMGALVLGGGFGRGEGTVALAVDPAGTSHAGAAPQVVPVNDFDIFIIARRLLSTAELAAARSAILARTRVAEVDLIVLPEAELAELPLTLRSFDLREGHRVLWGDAALMERIPAFDARRLPLYEAEDLLRNRLVTLLLGHPGEGREREAVYQTAKAVLAAADARLILAHRYVARLADKPRALVSAGASGELLALFAAARDAKLSLELPAGWTAASLWAAALREHLDTFAEVLGARGRSRQERLARLLRFVSVRSVERRRTLRRCARKLLFRNRKGDVERRLLALLVSRDPDAPPAPGPEPDFAAAREQAVAAWYLDCRGR